MNKEKQTYLSPETEALVVRFEGVICGSPNYGVQGAAGASQGFNEYGSDF
jgi:hypothetical protein